MLFFYQIALGMSNSVTRSLPFYTQRSEDLNKERNAGVLVGTVYISFAGP